jgi:hypothetical protein
VNECRGSGSKGLVGCFPYLLVTVSFEQSNLNNKVDVESITKYHFTVGFQPTRLSGIIAYCVELELECQSSFHHLEFRSFIA